MPDHEHAEEKITTLDRITVVMARCLTVFVPSWNRIAVIIDSVFMVMASRLIVSVSQKRLESVLKSIELKRVRKIKVCTRVGATSSTFIWSRDGLHSSSDMQPNQQVQQQIGKNRRSEPKMESNKSVDGRQKPRPS